MNRLNLDRYTSSNGKRNGVSNAAQGETSQDSAAASTIAIADERAAVGFFTLGGEAYCNLLFNYGTSYTATVEDLCALLRSTGGPVLVARKLSDKERATIEGEERNIAHECYGRFVTDVPERWRSPRLFPAHYRVLGAQNARWPLSRKQFIAELCKRWPAATIDSRRLTPAVGFTIPRAGLIYQGVFDSAASSVTLYAPIDLSAELACWLRGLLPAHEALRLVDHAGTFEAEIQHNTTVAGLIKARTGERPESRTPRRLKASS